MFVDEKNQDRAFKLDAMMRRRREIDLLNEGKAIGINEGKVIGINEGKNIATADFTRALFKSGMSSEEISLRLHMPLDRVRSMIQNFKST